MSRTGLCTITIVVGMLLLCLVPAGAAEEAESECWAILVGVEKFGDLSIEGLPGGEGDVMKIAETFRFIGMKKDRIIILTDGGGGNEPATKTKLLASIEKMKKSVGKSDSFFFLFAGRSVVCPTGEYLLTYDASVKSETHLQQSCVTVEQLGRLLGEIPSSRATVVIKTHRRDLAAAQAPPEILPEGLGGGASGVPAAKEKMDELRYYDLMDESDPILAAARIAGKKGKRLLVYFYDESDGSHAKVESLLSSAEAKPLLKKGFVLLRISQPDNPDVAQHYGCAEAPFLVVFKENGDVANFLTRAPLAAEFEKFLRKTAPAGSLK